MGRPGGSLYPFQRGLRIGVGDIGADRVGEDHGVLRHQPHLRAKAQERRLADVHAVNQDLPRGGLQEPQEQVRQRGLARAVGADHGDCLASLDGQGNVLHGRPLRARIGEVDVPYLDGLFESRQIDCSGRVLLARQVQDLEDARPRGLG